MVDFKYSIIYCSTKNHGVGIEGRYNKWSINDELRMLKKINVDSLLLIDSVTFSNFSTLKNRNVIITPEPGMDFESTINKVKKNNHTNVSIICGSEIYENVFEYGIRNNCIKKIHVSILNDAYICNKFVVPRYFTINEMEEHGNFTHYTLDPTYTSENLYLTLLRDVYNKGSIRVGRNGITRSMFGKNLSFDLRKGFPLLTTKRMFFRGVVEELLFFIRGDTDSSILEDKKVNIWKGNTSREFLNSVGKNNRKVGVMGPMYGYQWRNYGALYDEKSAGPLTKGLDQLKEVVEKIKSDPGSRRILLTDFNPLQAECGVLYPCHSIILQFYVNNGYLDMYCFNRSSDLFHGLPFNIASSALFLELVSMITGLIPRHFSLSLGDSHIYDEHKYAVEEQLSRYPFNLPVLNFKKVSSIEEVEKMTASDFTINNYVHHSSIKVPMVA